MRLVKPAHLVVGRPQLAGLVDIDLARLLRVRLAKLLVDAQRVQPSLEDAPFAAEIGGAAQTEGRGQIDFGFMQHGTIGVVGQIEQVAAGPIGLERFGVAFRQGVGGWRVVRKRVVVDIFRSLRGRRPRLGRGGSAVRRIGQQFGLGRRFGRALDPRDGRRRRDGFDGSFDRLEGRGGGDVDQRHGFGAGLGADPLGLPVLVLGLVMGSLHIGSRISIVDATDVGDAGQGQQVLFTGRSVQLLVKLRHVHGDVFGDGLVGDRWFRWEQRLIGGDFGHVGVGGIEDRISVGVDAWYVPRPSLHGVSFVDWFLQPGRYGRRG